jgi:hypothetical protein
MFKEVSQFGATLNTLGINANIAREIKQEVDFDIDPAKLIDLGSTMSSPGGSDESILMYAYEIPKTITSDQIKNLQGSIHGAAEENETTITHITPLHELKYSNDAKTRLVYFTYMATMYNWNPEALCVPENRIPADKIKFVKMSQDDYTDVMSE